MNEHEASALLERLVEPLDAGVAPVAAIVARGRGSRTRRRGVAVMAAAASVAVVVGATTLLGRPEAGTPNPLPPVSSGPSQTVTEPVFRDVSFDDLIGEWRPVSVFGVVPEPGTDWGAIWFGDGWVSTSYECTHWQGMIHQFGGQGVFSAMVKPTTMRSCLPGPDGSWREPDSASVLRKARRITLVGDELAFYGKGDAVLGTYTRNWLDVSADDLLGSWRPIRLFGQEAHRFNGRLPLLHFDGHWADADWVRADDGINDTSAHLRLGPSGRWSVFDTSITTVGCVGGCPLVRNPDVITSATHVQLFNGALAFFDADSHLIGLYHRN
jgi:hypothetical protein